jgi:hypothetical protein
MEERKENETSGRRVRNKNVRDASQAQVQLPKLCLAIAEGITLVPFGSILIIVEEVHSS